jgi:hypothetical protein
LVDRLSIRGILRETIAVWWRDIRSLTVLAALLEIPIVLADIALHVTPGLRGFADGTLLITRGLLVVILYGALSHHFLAGILERVVGADRHGHERPTVGEVLRDLPWTRLIVADVLLTAMILLGLSLFVVPGLVAMTWFAVVLPIINLERRSVGASFRRSYELVRGHSWRVAAVAIVAFAVPETIVGFVGDRAHTGNVVLDALAHAAPAIVLMPLAALPIVIVTFDLVAIDARVRGGRVATEK